VVHVEFELDASMNYSSGDALGIFPVNNKKHVQRLIQVLSSIFSLDPEYTADIMIDCSVIGGYNPSFVEPSDSCSISLQNALLFFYDLKTVTPNFLLALYNVNNKANELDEEGIKKTKKKRGEEKKRRKNREKKELERLVREGEEVSSNVPLKLFIQLHLFHHVLFLFPSLVPSFHPHPPTAILSILSYMKTLHPRYYSISSYPIVTPRNTVIASVAASVIRYTTLDEKCEGVTTTYLSDRIEVGDSCAVFLSRNPGFRVPVSGDAAMIMIGPGTGIAPFRAFIQERIVKEAKGKNLVYFGCRDRDLDFLYKSELLRWEQENIIQLRTAFSRENPKQKVYVQHKIEEDGEFIFELIEKENAHIYICGEGNRMAGDVEATLVKVISVFGRLNLEEAEHYLEDLRHQARYKLDVWIT